MRSRARSKAASTSLGSQVAVDHRADAALVSMRCEPGGSNFASRGFSA